MVVARARAMSVGSWESGVGSDGSVVVRESGSRGVGVSAVLRPQEVEDWVDDLRRACRKVGMIGATFQQYRNRAFARLRREGVAPFDIYQLLGVVAIRGNCIKERLIDERLWEVAKLLEEEK